MLIREWMTKDVITVTPDTSMLKASKLMKDHNIRRLPVLDWKRVVGIVSDRDIRAASPSKATTLDMHELYYLLSEVKVKDIMTSDPVTVYDTDAVDAAALLMENKGIGGLPGSLWASSPIMTSSGCWWTSAARARAAFSLPSCFPTSPAC